jgi:hypothetical protein
VVAGGPYDSSLTRVRPFFNALIRADPSGETWVSRLLSEVPNRDVLGLSLKAPGALLTSITAMTDRGHLACYEYPVHPPRLLLTWFVENPDQLVWPRGQTFSEETTRLRKALLYDSPPGSRQVAQARARELVASRPTSAREWWRFEGTSMLDCVLLTDEVVVTIEGKRTEPVSPATDWYPKRSQLVRNLEAARQLSQGRAWGSLLISETLTPEGTDAALDRVLSSGAPHLAAAQRDELHAHYLGNITWPRACDATGLDPAVLPESTDDL